MCVLSTTHDLFLLLKKPWHPPSLLLITVLKTFTSTTGIIESSNGYFRS